MSRTLVRRSIPCLLAALFVMASSPAIALDPFRADISAVNEVPPAASPATGVAHILIDTAANTLKYHISYSGLTAGETAAHIHGFAAPGANAGVRHGLPGGQPKVGTWTYLAGDEANILGGLTYINIHTAAFPGGEIRGQIVPDAAVQLAATIDATQEVPPNASTAMGVAVFTINTVTNMLSYDIRYAGLLGSETAAHIHGMAPSGVNAGVVHGLTPGSPKIGAWNYLESQEAGILGDLTYVNIHSTLWPGGEIRGQVLNLLGPVGVSLPSEAAESGTSLRAFPNPIRNGSTALFYRAADGAGIEVDIIDVQGRVIRRLHRGASSGDGLLTWDTRDDAGRPVPTGVYFARITARDETSVGRLVVLR